MLPEKEKKTTHTGQRELTNMSLYSTGKSALNCLSSLRYCFYKVKSIKSRPSRKKTQAHARIQKSIISVSRSFSEANTTRCLGTENMDSNTVLSKQTAT